MSGPLSHAFVLGEVGPSAGARFALAYDRLAPEDAARSEHLSRVCQTRSSRGLPPLERSESSPVTMPPPSGALCGICEEPLPGTRRPNKSGVCTRCREGMSSRRRREVLAAIKAQLDLPLPK